VFVKDKRLDDLLAARVDRIERGHRLLKDHRDFPPANRPHFGVCQRNEIAALEQNASANDAAWRLWH
jgi:hypothetical protein